jgi:hypothetical protein
VSRPQWSKKRSANLVEDLNILLGDLCTQWGFCNQLGGDELVRDYQIVTADDFAQAVLRAEGMNPEYELAWRRKMKRLFINRYGQSVSVGNFMLQ